MIEQQNKLKFKLGKRFETIIEPVQANSKTNVFAVKSDSPR